MYLKNLEEIKFNGILVKVPFDYTKAQDKDRLTLLKFPKGGGAIFFKKDYLSKKRFNDEIKIKLNKMDYNLIDEGEISIDYEKGYFIIASNKFHPSEYKEYVTIPNRSITISFVGDKKDSKSFWEIVKQIRFDSRNNG
jgi:hypothetical protein